jgi:plasmid stability protein
MNNATEAITVRGLDAGTKRKLRLRAAEHGHSMEEEVRTIIRKAVSGEAETDLATTIHRIFSEIGGVELDLPPREPVRDPPDFSGPEYDPP